MRVMTDTATLVLFDPLSLADKVSQECDWWTGSGDLDREEASGTLVFVDTRSDGIYEITVGVRTELPSESPLKRSRLNAPSGELLFGPGECLPGEGEAIRAQLGSLQVAPGTFDVAVYHSPGTHDTPDHYTFLLHRR